MIAPTVFMLVMTVWSLGILVVEARTAEVVRLVAGFLLALALVLAFEAFRTFTARLRVPQEVLEPAE